MASQQPAQPLRWVRKIRRLKEDRFSSCVLASMVSGIFSLAAASDFSWMALRLDHSHGGLLAFAEPDRVVQQHPETLRRWRHLERVFVRIHAFRELHPEAFDPQRHEFAGVFLRCSFSRASRS